MKRALMSACLCLSLLGSGLPAAGQATPYDNDLRRLSEILGALHYLRALCGANEGPEAPSGSRRSQMILNFNRGYSTYQQSYRTCTPPAEVAIRRYLQEGAKISREVTARYAN